MVDLNVQLDEYLEKTGQSEQDLYAGAEAYGVQFILKELVPKALEEKKKIVWKDEPDTGIGAMSYSLEQL